MGPVSQHLGGTLKIPHTKSRMLWSVALSLLGYLLNPTLFSNKNCNGCHLRHEELSPPLTLYSSLSPCGIKPYINTLFLVYCLPPDNQIPILT